jgi:c-di-GMP-binding flagellar brake protein YcgR
MAATGVTMKTAHVRDRRHSRRFPHRIKLNARKLSPPGAVARESRPIRGRTRDISEGGICFVGDRSLPTSSLVRCEILLPDMAVPIPTLMQVRWSAQRKSLDAQYVCGLQFVL